MIILLQEHNSMHMVPSMKQKVHQFLVRTFSSPTKCNHCTSLMVPNLASTLYQYIAIIKFYLENFLN